MQNTSEKTREMGRAEGARRRKRVTRSPCDIVAPTVAVCVTEVLDAVN